ncbi:S26 family signal peptidase [Sphingopyxis fribergensis]
MIYETRWLLFAEAIIFLVAATLLLQPRPLLVWNVSASAPVGLYWVGGKDDLARGDMVIAWLPERSRLLAARRSYVPMNVPLVKRVVGVAGDTVCAKGAAVRVNGKIVAWRRALDARSREMPWWSGCVELVEDDYFLVMSDSPASFDGRYFGVSNADDVIGKAVLLWRR